MNRAPFNPSSTPNVSPMPLDTAATCEQLSALMDGELEAGFVDRLFQEDGNAVCATWDSYHLIGAVLRGDDRPEPTDAARVAAIMGAVRASAQAAAPAVSEAAQVVPSRLVGHEAANDAVFRWKLLAGFASLAAVVAVAWNMTAVVPSAQVPQLAQASGQPSAPATVAVAQLPAPEPVVVQQGQQGAMLRDPRLEELMAAHRQLGGMSALQMPAGFLRNAAFDLPESQR